MGVSEKEQIKQERNNCQNCIGKHPQNESFIERAQHYRKTDLYQSTEFEISEQ